MTPEQKPLLVDAGRGFCIYWQERPLYPVQDPQVKLIEKVLRTSWQPETLVFIPSPLLYYGLPELLQNLPPRVFLLTYEHEAALRQLAPLPADPRIKELPALNEESIQNCLKAFGPENVRRVVVLRLSGSVSLHMETYKNIEVKLEEEIQTFWKNRMTALRLGTLWLKNLFKNLPLLARYPALDPRGDETPLVIAGAGPSLELALPILRKHRTKSPLSGSYSPSSTHCGANRTGLGDGS